MVVGVLRLRMLARGAHSLKDKRRALKSLKDRLRRQFNVSVAEIGELELHQRFELGVAAVGDDRRYVNGLLSKVVNAAAADYGAEMLDYTLELT